MPMTPLMASVVNIMEETLRPQMAGAVDAEYKRRAGHNPLPARTQELVDGCLFSMRLKLEECYDLKLTAGDVRVRCMQAIREHLKTELDKEFPKLVVTE